MDKEPNSSNARTYAATLAYHGAAFSGFARQPNVLTVQGNVEQALAVLFACPVETVCAGRTDAGVHARGQVVSFSVSEYAVRNRTTSALVRSLNALTHEAVVVTSIDERPNTFSARFDAVSREYRYFICAQPTPPIFMREFSWHIPKPLDVARMQQAAHALEGEHDFKSFCVAASARGKRTQRFVESIRFDTAEIMGERMLVITVVGNAFLHSMVRTIVGTLVKVGLGHREVSWVSQVLKAKNRSQAGETAPAHGLVLWSVKYVGPRCAYAPVYQSTSACGGALGDTLDVVRAALGVAPCSADAALGAVPSSASQVAPTGE